MSALTEVAHLARDVFIRFQKDTGTVTIISCRSTVVQFAQMASSMRFDAQLHARYRGSMHRFGADVHACGHSCRQSVGFNTAAEMQAGAEPGGWSYAVDDHMQKSAEPDSNFDSAAPCRIIRT